MALRSRNYHSPNFVWVACRHLSAPDARRERHFRFGAVPLCFLWHEGRVRTSWPSTRPAITLHKLPTHPAESELAGKCELSSLCDHPPARPSVPRGSRHVVLTSRWGALCDAAPLARVIASNASSILCTPTSRAEGTNPIRLARQTRSNGFRCA